MSECNFSLLRLGWGYSIGSLPMSTLQKVSLKVSRFVECGLKPSCHFVLLEEEGISIVVARTNPGLTEQKQTDQKVTAVSNEQQFLSRLLCISQKVGLSNQS